MADARVVKIAKLRAKAQSTAYPAEAETFRRKALVLMEKHGIGEEAVQRAWPRSSAGATSSTRARRQDRPPTAPPNAAASSKPSCGSSKSRTTGRCAPGRSGH